MHVYFAQSLLSLDINALITELFTKLIAKLSALIIVHSTEPCHTNLHEISRSHTFKNVYLVSCFQMSTWGLQNKRPYVS